MLKDESRSQTYGSGGGVFRPPVTAPAEAAEGDLPWEGLSHDELRALARRSMPADQADELVQEFACRRLEEGNRRRVNPSYARRAFSWMRAEALRRRGRRLQILEQVPPKEASEGGVDLDLEHEEELRLIRELIENMEVEGESGRLLRLRYWDGLTVPQIARRLGRPGRTVENQLARAKHEVRARFLTRSGGASRSEVRALGLLFFGLSESTPPPVGVVSLSSKTGLVALAATVALVSAWAPWRTPGQEGGARDVHGAEPGPDRQGTVATTDLRGEALGTRRQATGSTVATMAAPVGPAAASGWPPGFTPTGIELRVFEGTCQPVDGFEVWVPNRRRTGSRHPGNGPEVQPLAFAGSVTTLHLPPDHEGGAFTCFVSSPDHAWTAVRGRVNESAPITVLLDPACTLEVNLGGVPIGRGWDLSLGAGESTPVLRTRLAPGNLSLRFERLAPGSFEAEVSRSLLGAFQEGGEQWILVKDQPYSARVPVELHPEAPETLVLTLDYPASDLRAPVLQGFEFAGAVATEGWRDLEMEVFPLAPESGVPVAKRFTPRSAAAELDLLPGPYVLVSPRTGYRSPRFDVPEFMGPPLAFDLPDLVDLGPFLERQDVGPGHVLLPIDGDRRSLTGISAQPRRLDGRGPFCVPGTYRLADLSRGLYLGETDSMLLEVTTDGRVVERGVAPARWTHEAEILLRLPGGETYPVDSLCLAVEALSPGLEVLGNLIENRADGAQPLPTLGNPLTPTNPVLWLSGPGVLRLGGFEVPGYEPLPERIVSIQQAASTVAYDLVPVCR